MNKPYAPRNRRCSRPGRTHRGMSLAEVLVAMTVFVVAAAVALILYNALRQSYKRGDNAADVQQNTRLAFERMVTDGRMAGFNFNPDGSEDRPDEQIEGAWDTAITFRGDYDFDDPTASIAPEASLAGGAELSVSIGNDEIVTYALAKSDGTSSDSLSFEADVQGVPRDGTVETVTVSNIALVHDSPPYTLYRITVDANSTSVKRTPVADNIYSLRFRYLDSGAVLLSPDTPLDASDDIGGVDSSTGIATRETIRQVELSITGMTEDPDMNYTDPDDPYSPSDKHRKFVLTQDITPRNLGYEGRPDIDIIPPAQPTNVAACAGHCESALVTWDAANPGDLVQQWTVVRGPTTSALGSPTTARTNQVLVGGMALASNNYFRVRAEDLSGNVSPMSNLANGGSALTITDQGPPSAPSLLEVSGGSGAVPEYEDLISMRWTEVTTNPDAVTCDPEPNKIRDLKGYQIYRSEAPNAFPGSPYRFYPAGSSDEEDDGVVACRTYYYNVTAVDKCDNESQPFTTEQDGSATTTHLPVQGSGMQAAPSGPNTNTLAWDQIVKNTANSFVTVDKYRLYRAEGIPGLTPGQALANIDWGAAYPIDTGTVGDVKAPAYVDDSAYPYDPANSFYYRVAGLTDCNAPYDEGAMSDPMEAAACSLGASVLLAPDDGTRIAGSSSVGLGVSGASPGDTFTGFITISDPFGSVIATHGSGVSPLSLPTTFLWTTISLPPGDYVITGTVRNGTGCSESVSHTVSVAAPVPCCIAPQNPVLGPARGKVSQRNSDVLFNLVNNCGQDLQVTKMDYQWTNLLGFKRIEHLCFDVDPATAPEDCLDTAVFSLDYVPPTIGPINQTFTPALGFAAGQDDLSPLVMGFQYDAALIDVDAGTGETIGMDIFYFPVGGTDEIQCTFQIQTNPLDIIVIDPEAPAVSP